MVLTAPYVARMLREEALMERAAGAARPAPVADGVGRLVVVRWSARSRSTGWWSTSLPPRRDIRAPEPTWHPFGGTLGNYRRLFDDGEFFSTR